MSLDACMFLKNDQNMYSIIVFITAIDNILTETCMNYKMAEKEKWSAKRRYNWTGSSLNIGTSCVAASWR